MAMGAAAIRAGRAFVEILAEDSQARRTLKRFQAHMQSWSTTMNNLGRSLFLPGLAVALPMLNTIKVFADFEQQMQRVRARIDQADEGFEKLKKSAIELGKATMFSPAEVAAGMAELAQAGNDSAAILERMPAVINFAAAAEMNLAEAALFASTSLKVFHLEGSQLAHMTDIIVKAANISETSVQEMAEAFSYAGPSFAQVGGSVQELAGALSLLAHAGQRGDRAGTALRGVFAALLDPSEKANAVISELVGNVLTAEGKFIGLTTVVERMQKSLSGVGGGAKLANISKIFDNRMASAIAALVESKPGELAAEITKVWESQGAAALMAKIQMDSLKGEFKRLIGAMQALQITLTESVVVPLRNATVAVRVFIAGVDEWAKRNPGLVTQLFAIGAAVIVAGPALIALSLAMKLTAFALQPVLVGMTVLRMGIFGLGFAFMWLGKILLATVIPLLKTTLKIVGKGIVGLLAAIGGGIGELVAAMTGGIMFLVSNPIFLLGAALLAIGGYALYVSGIWGRAVAKMRASWIGFTTDAKTAWNGLMTAIQAGRMDLAFKIIATTMEISWLNMIDVLMTTWEDFGVFFGDVFDNAITGAAQGMLKLLSPIESAAAAFKALMDMMGAGEPIKQKEMPAGGQFSVPPENVPPIGLVPPAEHPPLDAGEMPAIPKIKDSRFDMILRLQRRGVERRKRVGRSMKGHRDRVAMREERKRNRENNKLPEDSDVMTPAEERAFQKSEDWQAARDRDMGALSTPIPKFTPEKMPNPVIPNDAAGGLEAQRQAREMERRNRADQARFERQQELKKKRGRLDLALEQAREALRRSQGKNVGTGGPGGFGGPDLSQLKSTVVGTFSAEGARGIGAGNPLMSRVAVATEKTAKGVEDLNKKKGGGLGK